MNSIHKTTVEYIVNKYDSHKLGLGDNKLETHKHLHFGVLKVVSETLINSCLRLSYYGSPQLVICDYLDFYRSNDVNMYYKNYKALNLRQILLILFPEKHI